VNPEAGTAEVVFEVTWSEGHEDDLALGCLDTTRLDKKSSCAALKPFSMGSGLAMRYQARFADQLEDIMFKSEDDG
jgi:hypothetical protein